MPPQWPRACTLSPVHTMPNPQTRSSESSSVAVQDRRCEQRAVVEFPIEVCGFDRFGRFHTEYTKTRNVSLMGCAFPLHMEVEKGLVLALRVIHPKDACKTATRPVLFQIARTEPRPDGQLVGAMRLQPESPWVDYIQEEETDNALQHAD
jgi:hypothetical protein